MEQLPTGPVDSRRLAVMKADLADLERLKGGHLGGALFATALMGPSLIPLMRVGFLWLSLIPPTVWGLFTGHLWRRYIQLARQAARLSVEIEESEGAGLGP